MLVLGRCSAAGFLDTDAEGELQLQVGAPVKQVHGTVQHIITSIQQQRGSAAVVWPVHARDDNNPCCGVAHTLMGCLNVAALDN